MLLFVASIMHRLLRKKLMPVRSGGASRRAVPQGEEKSLYSLFYLFIGVIIVMSLLIRYCYLSCCPSAVGGRFLSAFLFHGATLPLLEDMACTSLEKVAHYHARHYIALCHCLCPRIAAARWWF